MITEILIQLKDSLALFFGAILLALAFVAGLFMAIFNLYRQR